MPSPLPCSPVIHEWSWKKTQIEKNMYILFESSSKISSHVAVNKDAAIVITALLTSFEQCKAVVNITVS